MRKIEKQKPSNKKLYLKSERPLTEAQKTKVLDLLRQGHFPTEVAYKMKISYNRIIRTRFDDVDFEEQFHKLYDLAMEKKAGLVEENLFKTAAGNTKKKTTTYQRNEEGELEVKSVKHEEETASPGYLNVVLKAYRKERYSDKDLAKRLDELEGILNVDELKKEIERLGKATGIIKSEDDVNNNVNNP